MRRGGTLVSLARRYWLTPKGTRNSANRISPGCTGRSLRFAMANASMIIHDFDSVRVPVYPTKTDSPLIVNANTVLSVPITTQAFQPVAGRDAKIHQRFRSIEQKQFSERDSM